MYVHFSQARGAKVVCVSSVAHRMGGKQFIEDGEALETDPYLPWKAYGNAKLANQMFAKEMNAQWSEHGIQCFSVHPGGIHTNLQTHVTLGTRLFWAFVTPFFFKSIEQGAATTVFCALSPRAGDHAGEYFYDCNVQVSSRKELLDDQGLRKTLMIKTRRIIEKFM